MWSKLTLKKIIIIIKLSLFITWCWPPSQDAIKLKVICAGIYQYFCLTVTFSVAVGLMNTVRNHFDDPVIMAQSISVLCPALQVVCNIMFCKFNFYRLQVININTFSCFVEIKSRQNLPLYMPFLFCEFI